MKNNKVYDILNTNNVKIDKLFWVAGATTNEDLEYLLEVLEQDQISELFPDLEFNDDFGITIRDLLDNEKFGLIAEIHIPEPKNLKIKISSEFDNQGNITTLSAGAVSSRVKYVYAETRSELISVIEKVANKVFNEYAEKAKKK